MAVQLAPLFDHVPIRAGHYESIYLVANSPGDGVALWIRYTVHKRPGAAATASIWFTLFTPDGPQAVKVTSDELSTDETNLLSVGEYGVVRRDGAFGSISGAGITGTGPDATWALRFTPSANELRHLPRDWLYRAPIPKTKSTSPYPSMRVTGSATIGSRTVELRNWRGMLGHNWGSEHAHRWIWLRGASFDEQPDAWLDVVIGRIKAGPATSPWIANGVLAAADDSGGGTVTRSRLGGLGRRVSVTERQDGCDLVLPGRDGALTVSVNAPLAASVGWEYADPAGGLHQVRNCSVASVTVDARWRRSNTGRPTRLTSVRGGVYELGSAEFDPAVRTQPYPDG